MLNYFTHLTNFKHFGSSTCSHVHNQSNDTYSQHKAGDWIGTCDHVEDPKCLKFVRCFLLLFCLKKNSFGFCSCSELLQLKFRIFFAGNCKLLSSQDSDIGDYGCKWKIFTIFTTLWKGFNVNFFVLLL